MNSFAPSRSKYGNKPVCIDGYTFDSRKEYERYCELKLCMRAMNVKDRVDKIEVHPRFELQPSFVDAHGTRHRSIIYEADFRITYPAGRVVVEDVKGAFTETYKLKKKLLLYKFRDDPSFKFKEIV